MDINAAKSLLERYGQTQLLDYYDELDDAGKRELLSNVGDIDFQTFNSVSFSKDRTVGRISPADALSLSEIEKRRARFEEAGLQAIREGKVAAVLLAGGQGTRLGWNAPKGTFNIGVNRELSIFECQLNNLKEVVKRAGAEPHVFIMTSSINNEQTAEFFKVHDYFGYAPSKIHFYVQKTAPAVDLNGKILLEEKHKPAVTPNGNGGWYISLSQSPCGKILEDEGIEWLNVYGVDNVLQRICDPVFIGATLASGLNSSAKVVTKATPDEKVGVLCKEDGLPAVVEYYEMPAKLREEREEDGQLKYRYGVILNYLFKVEKLREIGAATLPYHLALKKVACIKDGKKFVPEQPNAYKLETLAVDIVKLTGSCLGFEVLRENEFAPVKNMTGVDSVETARALLIKNGVKI